MCLRLCTVFCAALLVSCGLAAAQDSFQTSQAIAAAKTNPPPGFISGTVPVYKLSKGITPPEPVPVDYSNVLSSDCERIEHVATDLRFVVDTIGKPRQAQVGEETNGNMTALLFQWIKTVHFKPAVMNGAPVVVGLSDKVSFDVCYVTTKDENGKTSQRIRLHSAPNHNFSSWKDAPKEITIYKDEPDAPGSEQVERIGGSVKPPVAIFTTDPEFSNQARAQKIQGAAVLRIIVDANGVTQDVEVVKPIGYGLDQKAIEAVKKYRFKPATKDGKPVAAYMVVQINFRLT